MVRIGVLEVGWGWKEIYGFVGAFVGMVGMVGIV